MYLSKISIRQYIAKFVSNSSHPSTKISPTASELILESRVDNIRGSVHDTDFAMYYFLCIKLLTRKDLIKLDLIFQRKY